MSQKNFISLTWVFPTIISLHEYMCVERHYWPFHTGLGSGSARILICEHPTARIQARAESERSPVHTAGSARARLGFFQAEPEPRPVWKGHMYWKPNITYRSWGQFWPRRDVTHHSFSIARSATMMGMSFLGLERPQNPQYCMYDGRWNKCSLA